MPSSLLLHSLAILGCLALASGQECNATGNCTERSDSTSQLLMVFGAAPCGGYNGRQEMSEVVTLIALDGDPPVPECLSNLNPFPTFLYGASGASLTNGKIPHICGGNYAEEGPFGPYSESDECYLYNPDTDTWMLSGVMPETRGCSYDGACAVNSVPAMFMTKYDSTLFTSDGETFGALPPMPKSPYKPCAVALEGGDLFVAGDDSANDDATTLLYHSDTMEWEQLPNMPTPRTGLMCGMVYNEAGEQEIIAAGGDYGLTTVEIYNVKTGEWRTGNPLPMPEGLAKATVVPVGDSFVLVGGSGRDKIWRYERLSDTWALQQTRVPSNGQESCGYPIAMTVDVDIFPPC